MTGASLIASGLVPKTTATFLVFTRPVRALRGQSEVPISHERKALGELLIGANRAEGDELFYPPGIPLVEKLDTHHRVLVKERGRVLPIEADASHLGREVDNYIGCGLLVEPPHVGAVDKVVFGEVGDSDALVSFFFQRIKCAPRKPLPPVIVILLSFMPTVKAVLVFPYVLVHGEVMICVIEALALRRFETLAGRFEAH